MPATSARRPIRRPRHVVTSDYDVIIVGAGAAGLSAALMLGRCRRRVLLCDGGSRRNAASPAVHGFLTRDGIAPKELWQIGCEQLKPYGTVELREVCVEDVRRDDNGRFSCKLSTGGTLTARKILLATGVDDVLPPIEGMRDYWGTGVLHCPYCHGYEVCGLPLAVYGRGKSVVGFALLISRWSDDVVICSDGPAGISDYARQRLRRHGIELREEPIERLTGGTDGLLQQIEFESGEPLPRRALFVHSEQQHHSQLARQLGCRVLNRGAVWVDKRIMTSVPGVYAAGDLTPAAQQALVAAAEGAQAGISINEQLTREECI